MNRQPNSAASSQSIPIEPEHDMPSSGIFPISQRALEAAILLAYRDTPKPEPVAPLPGIEQLFSSFTSHLTPSGPLAPSILLSSTLPYPSTLTSPYTSSVVPQQLLTSSLNNTPLKPTTQCKFDVDSILFGNTDAQLPQCSQQIVFNTTHHFTSTILSPFAPSSPLSPLITNPSRFITSPTHEEEADQREWGESVSTDSPDTSSSPNFDIRSYNVIAGIDAYARIGGTRNFRGFRLFRDIVRNRELEIADTRNAEEQVPKRLRRMSSS